MSLRIVVGGVSLLVVLQVILILETHTAQFTGIFKELKKRWLVFLLLFYWPDMILRVNEYTFSWSPWTLRLWVLTYWAVLNFF